jgi:hypothetical protein
MAGHLGRKKMLDRVLQLFYWPGVFCDAQDHCSTCPQCQKSSTRGVKKAPLVPLPIMDEPFKRITMNIVGPLTSQQFREEIHPCDLRLHDLLPGGSGAKEYRCQRRR